MALLTPILSGGNGTPTYNVGMADTWSWVPIQNDQNRNFFARAVYVVNSSSGTQGGQYITGTDVTTGLWHSIYTVTTTTFSGTSGSAPITGLGSVAIPANVTLTGSFSAIQLASGSVIAYY